MKTISKILFFALLIYAPVEMYRVTMGDKAWITGIVINKTRGEEQAGRYKRPKTEYRFRMDIQTERGVMNRVFAADVWYSYEIGNKVRFNYRYGQQLPFYYFPLVVITIIEVVLACYGVIILLLVWLDWAFSATRNKTNYTSNCS